MIRKITLQVSIFFLTVKYLISKGKIMDTFIAVRLIPVVGLGEVAQGDGRREAGYCNAEKN